MPTTIKTPLFLILLSLTMSSAALDDADIVQGLEALGDLETAYPLAMQVTQQENSYKAWRDLAKKYHQYDNDNQAYLAAWSAVKKLNLENAYRDFLKLRPQSPLNAQTIHALFLLSRELDTIQGYLRLMEDFPNTPEAVQALLRIHEIAFSRAQEKHQPDIYDAFVQTFTGAKQIPQVIELAYQAEKTNLITQDEKTTDSGHERLARRLFNEVREAEKANNVLVMDRKYRLLGLDRFKDTQVYTELLDREERLSYHQRQSQQQADLIANMDKLRQSVVQELKTQGQSTRTSIHSQGQVISETIKTQGQKLEHSIQTQGERISQSIHTQGQGMIQAIEIHSNQLSQVLNTHNQMMEKQLKQTNQRLDQNIAEVYSSTRQAFEKVYTEMNSQMGAISDAIYNHTQKMRQAATQEREQEQALFRQAQEEASELANNQHKCAMELAGRTDYIMFSDCNY
ncbi:hypothetical protein [Candidatus Venteria ishoeyi]|uniref:Chromosome partition protein Smc n=1 Tax=Candidatus Venteria ishoeyi TaxID=1899563 RepID=A0A1H6F3M1_9GAMM|nr:hypothetical protein [Candidatus Venteria ishoeyi]SEH04768.1 Uncharacterised protein [Candidatus Venteria ishoeyi]